MLWDTGLCRCAPQVLNTLGRKILIPEWSGDLFTAVITSLFVPVAALVPSICLWRLEVEALACKVVVKGRKGRQRC